MDITWPEICDIARACGHAEAMAECRDDATLDSIREGASKIVRLLEPITRKGADD